MLEVTIYIVVTIPLIIYLLAKVDILFTTLESGDIKFIMKGESLDKIIYDVPGFELVNGKFTPSTRKRPHPWLGLYWVGIPPFASVHHFLITKEREDPAGKTPEEWIKRDKEEVDVSSLWFTFPRPYVLRAVELGDRTPVDVLVMAKFEVVNPYVPVFLFKGKFFENAGADIRAAVSDLLKGTPGDVLTLSKFVAADKGEVAGILSSMKDPAGRFNDELIRQVGIRLVGISIPQYDPSDKLVREAMNARIIAEEKAEGLVAEATGHARQLAIRVEADASAKERLAQARGVEIKETVEAMALTLAAPDIIAAGVANVLEMEAATGPNSKLTTLVKNSGASAVVPVGGERK